VADTKQRDSTTPIVLVGAVGALGLGAWLMFRPKGAKAGDKVTATFRFNYYGDGGKYILQISLGTIWPLSIFDHIDGMTWESDIELSVLDEGGEELKRPIHFKHEIEFQLPGATKPQRYDAEAGIRMPGSGQFDFVENGVVLIDNALLVEEKK